MFKKSNTHPKKMLKLNPHMETFQIYFGRSPCKDFTLRLKLCKCLIFVTPHLVTMSLSWGLSPLVILRWPKWKMWLVTCEMHFFCMSSPKYISRNALKPLATMFEPLLKTFKFWVLWDWTVLYTSECVISCYLYRQLR